MADIQKSALNLICATKGIPQPLNRHHALGPDSLEPDEARAFVYRGIAGAIICPICTALTGLIMKEPIDPDSWIYVVLAGYAGGSLGLGFLEWKVRTSLGAPAAPDSPPEPPPAILPPREKVPFRFASWDDEAER